MSELKVIDVDKMADVRSLSGRFYRKYEVDEVIAELKAKLESVQASAYADSVDAGMRERRLRRALWLARAERAKEMAKGYNAVVEWCSHSRWIEVKRKCLKKAEEYK